MPRNTARSTGSRPRARRGRSRRLRRRPRRMHPRRPDPRRRTQHAPLWSRAPTAYREVVQLLGSVGDTVVNVKLLIAEWGEGGCIEPPARVQVCHDEEHVIDDDAANPSLVHAINAGPGVATVGKPRAHWTAARAEVAREHRVGRHLAVMRECSGMYLEARR